jgi:CxxC-x17-CxxC domain-containing protein
MAFQDKTIKCADCGNDFTYTASEQELHQSLGYKNEPKRCPSCRSARKGRMGGGGRGFGGRSRGMGMGPRQLFNVTCADCGKETQVPFRPSANRPVYCSECFAKRKTEAH